MPPMAEHAETIAAVLYKCMKGLGTDEDNLYKMLRQVESPEMWLEVQAQFKKHHGDFHGGDLKAAIKDELTAKEEQEARAALMGAGVEWDASARPPIASPAHAASSPAASASSPPPPERKPGASLMQEERERMEWMLSLPVDQHREECRRDAEEFLSGCSGSTPGQSVGYASPASAPAAAPPGGRVDADHAETIAAMLHKCMKGLGTDEDGVYKALRQVDSQPMWGEVQRQFKARHADMCRGDLKAALKDELTGKEERRAHDALREGGVVW